MLVIRPQTSFWEFIFPTILISILDQFQVYKLNFTGRYQNMEIFNLMIRQVFSHIKNKFTTFHVSEIYFE